MGRIAAAFAFLCLVGALADAAALLGNPGDRHFMAAVARRIAG
jgi:hypothetical protein